MTIEFADPGFDWTAFIVVGYIVLVPLLVAGVAGIMYRLRSNHRSNADFVAYTCLWVAAGLAALGASVAGVTASGVYSDAKQANLYEALDKAGFEQISITYERGETPRMTGLLNGEPFVGTIEDLEYPNDYTYKVTELTP